MLNAKEVRDLPAEEKEAFHREAESRIQPFKYENPNDGKVKAFVRLTKSELQRVTVQVVNEGGENNLHYHTGSDTTWLVLAGRARFYGPGDVLIAEFSRHEGIMMPGGARYWFEKVGDEPLEMLQMVSYEAGAGKASRINLEAHKEWMESNASLKVYENG